MKVTRVNKAIVSGLASLLEMLNVAFSDDAFDLSERQHFVSSVVLFVVGVYFVWRVPNAPTEEGVKK